MDPIRNKNKPEGIEQPVVNQNKEDSFTDIYNQWIGNPDDEKAKAKFLKAAEPTINPPLTWQ